jgi:hypothetical protein
MSDKVQGWAWDLDLQPARKLVLLWLAGRATDNGVAFPGEREIRERTGLGERMVRYHLQWLAGDRDDTGQPKRPLVIRIERRISSQRNTSNVYILAVPWQEPNAVRHDLEELQHVTKAAIEQALTVLRQVGATDCPEGSGGNGLPRGGGNRLQAGTVTKERSPEHPPTPHGGAAAGGAERSRARACTRVCASFDEEQCFSPGTGGRVLPRPRHACGCRDADDAPPRVVDSPATRPSRSNRRRGRGLRPRHASDA